MSARGRFARIAAPAKEGLPAPVPDRSLTYTERGVFQMPAQPAWFHRLDEILETLQGMESTHLDRTLAAPAKPFAGQRR